VTIAGCALPVASAPDGAIDPDHARQALADARAVDLQRRVVNAVQRLRPWSGLRIVSIEELS
jgi:hypothetical protein